MNENLAEIIMEVLARMKILEAWCWEHNLDDKEFFISNNCVYCKKCNFPMEIVHNIDFFRCWGCDGTVSRRQVIENW